MRGDFKVLYIRRRDGTLAAGSYSRSEQCWTDIPLTMPEEYLTTRYEWSAGTLCRGTLYFTLTECIIPSNNRFLIDFDTNSELFLGMSFLPQIPNSGFTIVRLVDAKDQLVMFTATGFREMRIVMWVLQGEMWHQMQSLPPISLDQWTSLTHFVTTGDKWFVMAQYEKYFEIHSGMESYDRFYPETNWMLSNGALFTQTLYSPTI